MQQPHPPLVTIICLCYNHARYVAEALNSVVRQTYQHIELIVVDDASEDNSQDEIRAFMRECAVHKFIALSKNQGATRAFNQGLALANGEFIIDLAADDVLLPERVAQQVAAFSKLPTDYVVVYSDAWLIDQDGVRQRTFYSRDDKGQLLAVPPSGWIYAALISKQVVSSPTMMIRTNILRNLGGYDPLLSYEDYDFWVRSGRDYRYHFLPSPLMEKRVLPRSSRLGFYKVRHNPHLRSTLLVCRRAMDLNQSQSENSALAVSIRYHMRLAFLTENFWTAKHYIALLKHANTIKYSDWVWMLLVFMRLRVNPIYRRYLTRRYNI